MSLSKRTWHYRLHRLVWTTFDIEHYGPLAVTRGQRANHEPKSLCGYFWSTLLLTILSPIFVGVLALMCTVFFAVYYMFVWPIETIHHKREAARFARGEAARPSVTVAFVKAKKQRVCPTIQWM